MANVRYSAFPQIQPAVFYYGVDEAEAPASSWQHAGVRIDGTISNFVYDVSYASQKDYKDSTEAAVPDASYIDVQLGYKFGPITVKAEQETLQKGFKTPLATLHAFNGWADRFLTTPTNGLVDTNLKLTSKLADFSFVLAAHDFQSHVADQKFGQEVDFSVSRPLTSKLTGVLKFASFNADGTVAGYTNDTTKIWLQFAYKM